MISRADDVALARIAAKLVIGGVNISQIYNNFDNHSDHPNLTVENDSQDSQVSDPQSSRIIDIVVPAQR